MSWDVLEYPLVLEEVSRYTQFSLSRELILNLSPQYKPLWVIRENHRTEEAMEFLRIAGSCPMAGMRDIFTPLEKASKDITLGIEELMEVAVFGRGLSLAKSYYQKAEVKKVYLADLFDSIQEHTRVSIEIEKCISPSLEMLDSASSTLKSIRTRYRKALSDREQVTQRFMHQNASKLSDSISAIRNDRVVVLVKSSEKNSFGGLIHGESASGLSTYVEPPVLLDLNNKVSLLLEEEKEEIIRICKELSHLIKPISEDYINALETMALIDSYFARARFGEIHQGRVVELTDDSRIYFKGARHPLIDPKFVVANTYHLESSHPVLLITGPNTGGKTVSLKILGLFCLMGYSGIPVLADEAYCPMFDQIFVDIGDDQSIVQSLSTFSAHLSKLSTICDQATSKSLVLLDELGGGTDPQEGESLAIAVLDYLKHKGVKVVATTHYSKLKEYALKSNDVLMASVQFDMEAMRPTFKYLEGIAGQSYAFEIAARFNLNPSILEQALQLKTEAKSEQALLQEKLERKMIELKQFEETLLSQQAELNELRAKLIKQEELFNQDKEKRLNKAKEEIDALIETAQEEAQEILDEMRAQKQAPIHELITKKQQIDAKRLKVKQEPSLENIEIGDWVKLRSTNQQGQVIQLKKKQIVVNINGIRMEVSTSQVMRGEAPKSVKQVSIKHETVASVPLELNVIGYRVEEALPLVSQYIDNCLRAKMPFARIIHGHGTGALRQAVHTLLAKQDRIDTYRLGGQGEGGVGATVVTFKSQV
ncbi:MAG TPA: Smr/MutS family protein [Erysipelotrichaceae bacterium]|nr:Smr/MutS family protein [Erysipelotrichaceae bacterium]